MSLYLLKVLQSFLVHFLTLEPKHPISVPNLIVRRPQLLALDSIKMSNLTEKVRKIAFWMHSCKRNSYFPFFRVGTPRGAIFFPTPWWKY